MEHEPRIQRDPPPSATDRPIHVVAPSGPVNPEKYARGLATLRQNWRGPVSEAANIHVKEGYFAGSDDTRIDSLNSGLEHHEADILWCARGGYGCTRILSRLDPQKLRTRPRLFLGFSDITALLAWIWTSTGLPSLHAPVLNQFAGLHPQDQLHLFDWIRGEIPSPISADEGTVLHGGTVEGNLIAANLEVLRSLIGTMFMPKLDGCILALEEVTEMPYRIDRSLTQLLESGALRGIRGVAVGQLHNCQPPSTNGMISSPDALSVLSERLSRMGVPVITGFQFGHDATRNLALPFGKRVRLSAERGTLEFLEPIWPLQF